MLATAKYIGTDVMSSDLIGAVILILSILGFTIVLITMGIIIFKGGRGFTEGLQAVANQLTDPNLDPQKKIELTSHLDYYQKCYKSAIIKQNAAGEEMKNLSSYNDPDIIKSDFSELFNHLTDFID